MDNKQGFLFKNKKIKFLEGLGKDASFDRWRLILYYAPGLAETHFSYSEVDYKNFISTNSKYVYSDYDEYLKMEGDKGGLNNGKWRHRL